MENFESQKVMYNGEETRIAKIFNNGTCNIVNPDWNWDHEAECVKNGIDYDVPYYITVKVSELKTFFLVLFLAISISSWGQKTKSFDILRTQVYTLSGIVSFNNENQPKDTLYMLSGVDDRYRYAREYIILKSGSIQAIYKLIKQCQVVCKAEEEGTSLTFEKSRIRVEKLMGLKYINLSGEGQDEDGQTVLSPANLTRIITTIEKFCKSHNILLTDTEQPKK